LFCAFSARTSFDFFFPFFEELGCMSPDFLVGAKRSSFGNYWRPHPLVLLERGVLRFLTPFFSHGFTGRFFSYVLR